MAIIIVATIIVAANMLIVVATLLIVVAAFMIIFQIRRGDTVGVLHTKLVDHVVVVHLQVGPKALLCPRSSSNPRQATRTP